MFNSVSQTYCHVTAIFIRILVCQDTLTVLRCDRMPFFTRDQGKIFRDPFGGKCLLVKDVFHLTQSSHSFPDSLHRPMYFPPKIKIAPQLLLSNEKLEKLGRFPFDQKFRKFRFGAKWKTYFRFTRLENSQKKWNCSEGNPVFPVGTSQWKFVFHLQNSSSLSPVQFHAFWGLLSGQASLGSLVFPKNGGWSGSGFWNRFANKLQGYYECSACHVLVPDHGNLLQHECALYKSGR